MAVQSFVAALLLALLAVHEVKADAVSSSKRETSPQIEEKTHPAWNYEVDGLHGPEHWEDHYPDCGGKMQSPIDVNTSRVIYNKWLDYFDLSDYTKKEGVGMKLINAGGHTAEVIYSGTPLYVRGGGLPDEYKLDQFHFHWGKKDNRGSEHALDGVHYPLEMHIVHHQHHLDNVTDAASHPYGLAVISYLFRVGKHNDHLDQLLGHFQAIREAEDHIMIPAFPLADLLPPLEEMHFFRYYGSLTTPPCYETVIWSISTQLITISEDQLDIFRSLYDEERHQLVDDYRPIQELNHRVITTNKKTFYEGNHGNTISLGLATALLAASLAKAFVF